ncbi:MAG TPA: 2-phosphosulfolactate phosphatase [Bacteroidales bacterium]|nr:2-phosphosulfolactate phosphatase [Bacteroidales bacterium]
MDIQILQLLDGAKRAEGLTVVIDVFRAFSLACYMADKGAMDIIPIANIDKAYELKRNNPDYILVGERNERVPVGFDYGNSPTHILGADLKGKTIVHTTSAGTQGLVNAINTTERLTGSFVNAPAIARYIQSKNPAKVSLVCMGYSMKHPTEEDTFCAEYIKAMLEGLDADFEAMKQHIRKTSGRRLFEPENQEFSPTTDFDYCLDLGRFNFVLKVEEDGGLLKLKKIVS